MFRPQIGWNVEVYVNDMLLKILEEEKHLNDLQKTFNVSKCAFGVSSSKFLWFMVSHTGIEVNLDNIQAIRNIEPPRNIKEVQSLTGRVTALNRFISKAIKKCLPFFKVLKKAFVFSGVPACNKLSVD